MSQHNARERVPIPNSEYWLLNTARAKPTKEVLHAPHKLQQQTHAGKGGEEDDGEVEGLLVDAAHDEDA